MDTTKNNPLRSFLAVAAGALLVAGTVALPAPAKANVQCAFYRDLAVGSAGSDVSCLHQYLNSFGFAGSGSVYTTQTRASVAAWQAQNGIFPAAGYFGFVSRSRYSQLASTGGLTIVEPPVAIPPAFTSREAEALEDLRRAWQLIDETWDLYNDAIDDDDDVGDAAELLEDAEQNLMDGLYALLDRDFADATEFAEDAIDDAEDAEDEIDHRSGGSRRDAQDAIDDAEDAIDDARDTIEDADDDGADVRDAEDLLDEAEEALEDAEDAYDDGDYDDAEELAQDAEELAQDAEDAIDY